LPSPPAPSRLRPHDRHLWGLRGPRTLAMRYPPCGWSRLVAPYVGFARPARPVGRSRQSSRSTSARFGDWSRSRRRHHPFEGVRIRHNLGAGSSCAPANRQHPPVTRAWRARPGTPVSRDGTPMAQVSVLPHRPLLSVGNREGPSLRARGGARPARTKLAQVWQRWSQAEPEGETRPR
jgi:hypothetical protein